jgi:putative tryptophan/tyrosine transport system substrate-binding protein
MQFGQLKRREFITLLGGAGAWPLAARAQQQPAMPVIGWLNSESPDGTYGLMAAAFRKGLSETGFVEGRNVAIEYRWAESQTDRLPLLAAELIRRQVAVIATAGTSSALAARTATTRIPIVFSTAADPVAIGLVASLNRPGGNVTGVTNLGVELVQKQLEMLHQMVPTATIVAALVNPTFPASERQSKDLEVAARKLGLQLHVLHASTERDLDDVFATMAQLRAVALVVAPDAFFNSRQEQILALTARHSLPAIFAWREAAMAGGLMSYDVSNTDGYRLVGIYVGRILKGEKPGDLPVQELTDFKLVINLKTAKTLGLDVPLGLSAAADELIE